METWGASVVPSPSPDTNAGRGISARPTPDSPGSLGIAISEAVEDAATRDDTSYSLGSVLNHVLLHQTVIGQEAQKQLGAGGRERRRRRHRLRRRRHQLRRPRAAVRARQDRRRRDRDRRLRARRLPDADPRPVRLRLRRHRPADAAGPDAHARPRLRPAGHPRRRPALPRRRADRLAAAAGRPDQGRGVHRRPTCSRPRSSSPAARRSSRRPRAPTRSRARSTPPAAPTRPAPRRRSCSTCPATGTSTWPPTTPTCTAELEDFELPEAEIAAGAAGDREPAQAGGGDRLHMTTTARRAAGSSPKARVSARRCGRPLAVGAAAEERKLATVVFADLAGSTELALEVDAEALRALLADVYDQLSQAAAAFGGTVEKFIGDASWRCSACPGARGRPRAGGPRRARACALG